MSEAQWFAGFRRYARVPLLLALWAVNAHCQDTTTFSAPGTGAAGSIPIRSRSLPPALTEDSQIKVQLQRHILESYQQGKNHTHTVPDPFLEEAGQIDNDLLEDAKKRSKNNLRRESGRYNPENSAAPFSELKEELYPKPDIDSGLSQPPATAGEQYSLPAEAVQDWSDKNNDKDDTTFAKNGQGEKKREEDSSDSKDPDQTDKPSKKKPRVKVQVTVATLSAKTYTGPQPGISASPANNQIPDQSLRRVIDQAMQAERKKPGTNWQPVLAVRVRPDGSPVMFMAGVHKQAAEEIQDDQARSREATASPAPPNLIESMETDWQSVAEWLYTNKAVLIFGIKDTQLHISYTHYTENIEDSIATENSAHLLQLETPQPAGVTSVVDLHNNPGLAAAIFNLLTQGQSASLVLPGAINLIELDTWIHRHLPEEQQFTNGLPLREATRHILQNLRGEMLLVLSDQWLSRSMEQITAERVINIKTIWNAFSQDGTDTPMLVLAMLLSGDRLLNDHIRSVLNIDGKAGQKILPREELYQLTGMSAGNVCLFVLPDGDTHYVCVIEQEILNSLFPILASSSPEDPWLFVTGAGSAGVHLLVTQAVFGQHILYLREHSHFASGSFKETEADKVAIALKKEQSRLKQKKADQKKEEREKKKKEKSLDESEPQPQ